MPKYLLVVLPPADISIEIITFQKEIEERFGAVHAQKVSPHITVIPPFEAEVDQVRQFVQFLEQVLLEKTPQPISIYLDNFQRFESRTLFVDVGKNEYFEQFCKNMKLFFNQQKIRKQRVEKHFFVPHITLANKDIKKRDFKLLWEEFEQRNYQRSFELKELSLLKHNEQKWELEVSIKVDVFKTSEDF